MQNEINDYEVISLAKEKEEEAIELIHLKYNPLKIKICNKYEQIGKRNGLERKDLWQECSLALSIAIDNFNEKETCSFKTYASLCIEKHIINIIRFYQKNKYKTLNEAISLEDTDDNNIERIKMIKDNRKNPEELLLEKEKEKDFIKRIVSGLSSLEECVFLLKIQNFTYQEISNILDLSKKSIDNTLQRIRKKIGNLK